MPKKPRNAALTLGARSNGATLFRWLYDEIRTAMRVMLQTTGLLAEPSGAVALAAALFRRNELPDSRTVVAVLSGGNIEPELKLDLEDGAGTALPVERG